jgi:hypothetical protein
MAAGSAVQFAGQASATNAYNAQAMAGQRDAQIATGYKYRDLQTRRDFDNRSINQEGYKAALKGRDEVATATASAGASGIAAGSLTLDNLLAQSRQTAAQNEANVRAKRDDLTASLAGNLQSAEAEGRRQINSMPLKAGPSALGLAINLATAGAFGAQGGGLIDGKLGGFVAGKG